MNRQQRILLIKPSALGDVAATLPLLADVRAALPEAHIDWLIQPAFVPLVQGHKHLNGFIVFDRRRLASWWWNPTSFLAFMGLLRLLRRKQYDVVIDGQGLLRSGFFSRVTGAAMRIGFADAREGGRHAYTHPVTLPNGGKEMLAVDRMRALGAPLQTDRSQRADFSVPVSPEAARHAEGLLGGRDNVVAVVPGARWDTKRWPAERYVEVIRKLLREGEPVVLLGSPDERHLCEEIAQRAAMSAGGASDGTLLNLAGKTDVAAMIAVLARAKLVLANDSGPLHVAAALGKPVVALYGPTPPAFVGPYGQMDNVLRHDVPCHPCRRRTCDHHSCMQGLTVELVWEKTEKVRAGAAR